MPIGFRTTLLERTVLASVFSSHPSKMKNGDEEAEVQSPNRSPESDSDSDSDDEAQQNLQLQALESELSSNPSNYDTHLQYIKLLRKIGDIGKLREAREAMNALFPLTPAMWQEWAKDEATLNTGTEAYLAVERIYERGVFDYLSVSLWCDYLNFIQQNDPSVRECSPSGISKARNLFEHAITAAGLHVAEGSKIWESYRELEQAVLRTIHETDIQAKEKQVQRIRSIFHRQLSVPLVNLRSTLLAYKAWEVEQGNDLDVESSNVDGISSHVASSYQKALEMYNARVHLEEQISGQEKSDSERLQQFIIYLKFEQSSGDPARVQILYERAITEFPISSDLWLDYTRYMDRTLKVGNVVRDVYSRATKNCPWIGELWVQYMLSLERGRASMEEMASVFESSLQCTFSTLEEYLELFLTRVDGLRRRIPLDGKGEDAVDYSIIRETFQHASDYLSPNMKNTDGLLRLHAYWARLELNLGKDTVAARGVWESFLKTCGSMLEAWQGYIAMEIEQGHINEARSIYRRCYSKRFSGTGSEDICHSWIRFEREFGALEDFDHAVQKVSPRVEELRLFRLQQESKYLTESADQRENPLQKSTREKRKSSSDLADEQSPAKRQKDMTQHPKKVYGKDKAQGKNLVEPNKVEEIRASVDKSDRTNEQQMKEPAPKKTKGYTDQCTAFISNLDLKANTSHLDDFFSDVGGVVATRILHDKFTGKSRGLAYVDFSDEAYLAAAVAKNKQMLLGKKLSIARSDPKKNRKQSVGHSLPIESAHASDQTSAAGGAVSKEDVQLKGKNTFAVPRNVRALGWSANKPKAVEGEDQKPKSNDEFRNIFLQR